MIRIPRALMIPVLATCVACSSGEDSPGTIPSGQIDPIPGISAVTDEDLFAQSQDGDFTFFRNDDRRLPFTPGGGGHSGWIRMRFNPTAQSALDEQGDLPVGSTFPEGSVIVKETYDGETDPEPRLINVMRKAPSDPNAGGGWVWGEYRNDGSPVVAVSQKGQSCVSCHSITAENSPVAGDLGNRDLVRTFGLRTQ